MLQLYRFLPHMRHCVVPLRKTHLSLVLVQPRKTRPDITEKLFTRTYRIK